MESYSNIHRGRASNRLHDEERCKMKMKRKGSFCSCLSSRVNLLLFFLYTSFGFKDPINKGHWRYLLPTKAKYAEEKQGEIEKEEC